MLVPLSKGKHAQVDDEDAPLTQGSWHVDHAGYPVRQVTSNGKSTWLKLARMLVGAGPNERVIHRNGDRLDCRKANLFVYALDRPESRFWPKVSVREPGACWPWLGRRTPTGYGLFRVGSRMVPAHRYAWQITYGDIPNPMEVCHRCDNPCCCNPQHLFLGTQADNVRDMQAKGRRASFIGEANGRAKLTEAQVRTIRQLFAAGSTRTSLARSFGVTRNSIDNIVNRTTWRSVK